MRWSSKCHVIWSRVKARWHRPPPPHVHFSTLHKPHCRDSRDAPGTVRNQTIATVWIGTCLLMPMIHNTIFTQHVHLSALHRNQTTLEEGVGWGRTGSVRERRRHSPYWIVNCMDGSWCSSISCASSWGKTLTECTADLHGKRVLVQFGSTSIIPTDALVLCRNFTYNSVKKWTLCLVAVATRCENKPWASPSSNG